MMREEWTRKVKLLSEFTNLLLQTKVDDKLVNPIDDELNVVNKKSKVKYKVVSVGTNSVELAPPEGGEVFTVNAEDLEDDYGLK